MLALLLSILPTIFLKVIRPWLEMRYKHASEELRAKTEVELKQIDQAIQDADNRRQVRLATAGFWEMRLITFIIAAVATEHYVAVWMDTRWGIYQRGGWFERCWFQGGVEHCGVPAWPDPYNEWQGAILLSFFGITMIGKGISAATAAYVMKNKS